jgi:hypothetical protein
MIKFNATFSKANIEKKRKEEFIAELAKRLQAQKILYNILKTDVLNLVRKYDGKVFTKRFTNELGKIQIENVVVRVSYEDWRFSAQFRVSVEIFFEEDKFDYGKRFSTCFSVYTDNEKKVNAEKTIDELMKPQMWEHNEQYLKDLQSCIDNYDFYFEKAVQLEQAICDYVNETNSIVRDNFTLHNLFYLH